MKLGMLGLWHTHADGIVRRVAEHPDEFQLVGFHDADRELVERRRAEWEPRLGHWQSFDSPEKLLAEQLDGVVVEGRVWENVSLAKLAIQSGRPVMLEKPAGDRPGDFKQLADLAQRKHLHVQMIYLFRYMSAMQDLLRRARSGELGQVYAIRARLPKDLPSYDRYVDELGRYRGGIFFEMAGHIVDLMVAILGRPKSVAPFLAHHHTAPGDFVDNGVAVLGFEHAWGIIEVPALEVAPHARRIEVYGTGGAAVIPHLGSGHLANKNVQPIEWCRAGDAQWHTEELPAATLQIADLREFAAVVARRKRPDFSPEHDLDVQETLLAASGMG